LRPTAARDTQWESPEGGFETADKAGISAPLSELDLKTIAKSHIKVVLIRSVSGAWRQLPHLAGRVAVATVHDYRDVLFGGYAPEPDITCWAMPRRMKRLGKIGIATDGDADRFERDETARSFSPTTSLRRCSTTWWRRGDGRTGVAKSV
jgi:hypothetical protein